MLHIAAQAALVLIVCASVATAHALVNSPPVRTPGPAHLKTCGQASFARLNLDPSGHIEEQEPVNAGCDLTLCRGMLFADQPKANVQRVAPGQAMTMEVDCTIPHGGPANVTLLDTTDRGSGRIIGDRFLKTFDDFCPVPGPAPADQTNLQFALPSAEDIGDSCQQDGQCVVQLFWATPDLSQNYYYCVDVTVLASAGNQPDSNGQPTSQAPSTQQSSAIGPEATSINYSSTQTSPELLLPVVLLFTVWSLLSVWR
ncbi:hypothetical protein AURDEDRAFT_115624 [Auricularia subglabra TFB-10046 SS5]|nr:hypothetical protein AURDEDRAFT_115624 [Auricularia subglabra TFB-10046 SS5]